MDEAAVAQSLCILKQFNDRNDLIFSSIFVWLVLLCFSWCSKWNG